MIAQEIPSELETCIDHGEPIRVKAPIGFRIRNKSISFLIGLIRPFKILFGGFGEIVIINEIVPRIIGRIDVDHLHLVQVGLLKKLQSFEVVALNVEVLR